jgi:mRNA-degrading endonuclease toxin of MazEF toxin-antitoxin module
MFLPDRGPTGADPPGTVPKLKYVVVLQEESNATDVAVVVCNSLKAPRRPRAYEVLVGRSEGFDHDTMIDCRWVFTVQKRHLRAAEHPPLPRAVMNQVSEALVVGLQL